MKNLLVGIAILGLVWLGYAVLTPTPSTQQGFVGGSDFSYMSPTQSTATAGIYAWTSVLSTSTSLSYASVCDAATGGVSVNNPVFLYFGTASTTANSPAKPQGYRLASGACYEFTSDKLYQGPLYAQASTATTTLLIISK